MATLKPAVLGATPDLSRFSGTLALVGAGKMGFALLDGWLGLGLDPARLVVIEPRPSVDVAALVNRGARLNPPAETVRADAVLIAIKPQSAPEAMPRIAAFAGPSGLFVSVMAGRTLAFLAAALPETAAIVRCMPNTPAAVGRGITVAVPNGRVTPEQRALAHALLAAAGAVEWIDDETLLDAVTAVSGSGPAYVFLLAESLARAGAAAGLPADLAERLARATVSGSGELLRRSRGSAASLREAVTSPGGTTEAALAVLMGENGLDPLMKAAVQAAVQRSRALGG